MNDYSIINETNEKVNELDEIKKLLDFALNYLKIDNAIFNIIIVDEEKIQELNKTYRGKDSVTDVISFALEDDKTFNTTEVRMLGDIYISIDRVRSQAEEYGHSFKRELYFLSIHGLLHLLGYDHMNPEDEKKMFTKQEEVLNRYGIKRD